ncbi:MAG: carbohydrate ABC transporter permease [Fusobacteriota bacterium]
MVKSRGDKIFDIINTILILIFSMSILYPIWYIVVLSFNDGMDTMRGGIYWWPRVMTIKNYATVLKTPGIMLSYGVTVAKTVIGVVTHVLFTGMVAYGLSKEDLRFRKVYMGIGLVTMFFNGGLIPLFLLINKLGLLDSFWVYIIPALFNMFEMIVMMNFFKGLPKSLEESAFIDGASYVTIFFRIVLPLSMPVVATIALWNGVWQWNDFFAGVIYINNPNLQPIQTFLYKVISQAGASQMTTSLPASAVAKTTQESVKLATMVLTTFPIMCVYPFLQKYFVKGMMVGSTKG